MRPPVTTRALSSVESTAPPTAAAVPTLPASLGLLSVEELLKMLGPR
ncbi:hypothetical protein [Rhodococcus sp. MALMAid1271]